MNDLYAKVFKKCTTVIDGLATNSDDLCDVLEKIKDDESLDYDKFGPAFSKLYWQKNFWKALYFFEYEYQFDMRKNMNVLVLGAGSGADTIAFLTLLNKQKKLSKISLVLVDQSLEQLKIMKKLIRVTRPELRNISFEIEYKINIDQINDYKFDLVVMSHFLTENLNNLRGFINLIRDNTSGGGDIAIIERVKDPVWQKALQMISDKGFCVYSSKMKSEYLEQMTKKYSNISSHMNPIYVRASLPNLSYQADLIENYFIGWRQQSMSMIENLFSKDVTYDEKPGIEEIIEGIDGVLEYWEQNPMRQKNIDVSIKNIGFGPNSAVCAFEGEFDTPKQHISIRGAIDFGIDNFSKKICSVREYFGTVKTPFL